MGAFTTVLELLGLALLVAGLVLLGLACLWAALLLGGTLSLFVSNQISRQIRARAEAK